MNLMALQRILGFLRSAKASLTVLLLKCFLLEYFLILIYYNHTMNTT